MKNVNIAIKIADPAREAEGYIQGVSNVRGHFKKYILHPEFFIFLSIFLQTLTNLIVYRFSELFYESDKKTP